jgi:MFS transporter, DHA1 family, tetracycline resistance protein
MRLAEAPHTDAAPPASPRLTFVLLCAFIDMLNVGLAVPLLPVLVGEFVEARDIQALWFGVLTAVFGLMQFTCMPLLGALSDRIGRRPVLMISMAGMSINFLSTALAPNLASLFIGRIVGGMSAASLSVIAAYASDVSQPQQRARSYGQISAAFGLGFICGPMLGGLLGSIDIRLPFAVAGTLSAINLVYGALFIPESLPAGRRLKSRLRGVNPVAPMLAVLRDPRCGAAAWVFLLVTFANLLTQTTWVLYTAFRFGWTPRDNGIALFVVGVGAAVIQAGMLPWLLLRLGEKRLILTGLVAGAAACLLFGLATKGWMMYAIMPLNLLAFVVAPTLQGIVSKASAEQEQGVVMGSLQSIGSLGVFVIPLFGAGLLQNATHLASSDWRAGATFFTCAVMQAVAAVWALRSFR